MRKRWLTVVVGSMAAVVLTAPPSLGATAVVRARDNVFRPRSIFIDRGDTVKWVNRGENPHTTTSVAGLWNRSIAPGESASRRFRRRGTFRYVCTIHESAGMVGKVVVG
jgi:plastocyanin